MYAELSNCVSDELSTVQYEFSHTADNIRHFISDLLLQWDLTIKVVAVVWDGGTDITKALNDSAFVPVPCSAHLLQFVVRKAFLNNPFVQNQLVPKCRKIVSIFKHSTKYPNIETVTKPAFSPTQNDSRCSHTVE
ncbi:hypothetical protein PR048_002539 [Dryococelus australis]|uniref:Transposase n=1 Tax=Dryococelus australis TaxID=614101 RepID=A0ABQ9IKG3_9NEOP|nr:hypothetical protein PR048_002539 [Dryococelus australis]